MRIIVMMRTRTTLIEVAEAAIQGQGDLRMGVVVALMEKMELTINRALLVILKLVFASFGADFSSLYHVLIKPVCQIGIHFPNELG